MHCFHFSLLHVILLYIFICNLLFTFQTSLEAMGQLTLIFVFRRYLELYGSPSMHRFLRVPHVEYELLTIPEHMSLPPVFSGVRAARSYVFCVVICRSFFVLLSFFVYPLCCLSVFDLRLLITSLVSANFS